MPRKGFFFLLAFGNNIKYMNKTHVKSLLTKLGVLVVIFVVCSLTISGPYRILQFPLSMILWIFMFFVGFYVFVVFVQLVGAITTQKPNTVQSIPSGPVMSLEKQKTETGGELVKMLLSLGTLFVVAAIIFGCLLVFFLGIWAGWWGN